ncbi:hypothetical protein CLV82_0106 [Zeaxanthinibacter enoshimensis]|uniref:Uncharacterized protein n=1 Tax=Zeaxanthinibacter enoshimensis TaxID=392009 RepID=A0A4R6TQ95_9FLAO|nr:hypothetical protein [Zeaxanthinibacter enoshimensis]TDQ32283.1 hypothetical protein CLV82_0106 [Zeaxanthinibacter enoshimensis]
MAFVVMLSTVSFTVDMHFCGDSLVSLTLLKEAKNCGMEMQEHAASCEEMIAAKSCCTDKEFVKEGQKELKKSYQQIAAERITILFPHYFAYLHNIIIPENKPLRLEDYSPPLLSEDLKILYETYLI